jgi:hypothetical protein
MTENTRGKGSIAVASFQYTDHTTIDAESLLGCHADNVLAQTSIEFRRDVNLVTLHACALPLTRVKSGGEEDSGLRRLSHSSDLIRLVLEIAPRLLQDDAVLVFVEFPELLL